MEKIKNNAPRYSLLDVLRGIAIISMVLYHTAWDIVYIFNNNFSWFKGELGYIWQQSIGIAFIFISGFSAGLSKRLYKRGFFLLICGGIITAVTLIFMPENRIIFGILTFLGSAMVITRLLERFFKKTNSILGFFVSLLLFITFKNVKNGLIFGFRLPRALYENYLTTYLGFPPYSFWSTDYYGIVPWIFLFFVGYFTFKFFKEHRLLERLPKIKCPPIEFIGRHSLIIYMAHQPLIYALLSLFSWIFLAR